MPIGVLTASILFCISYGIFLLVSINTCFTDGFTSNNVGYVFGYIFYFVGGMVAVLLDYRLRDPERANLLIQGVQRV